jgi:putative transposase
MEIATDHILPALPDWAEAVPYQIKKMAINEACDAYTAAKRKYRRTGESRDYGPLARPELHYKSRKCPYQTCYIPKTAVKPRGIYPTLLGTMRYGERLPAAFRDCKLSYPVVPLCALPVPVGENQARMVALDPGVRNFLAFFSSQSAGILGEHDFGRLVRLCQHLDNLISRRAKSKNKKQRYRMRKAEYRLRWRIKDLRDELHAKAARFLVDHFDIILVPRFETGQMVARKGRKLRAKTVRSLLTWAHGEFKKKLQAVALQSGKLVVEVSEAYTSKTCSWSGELVRVGSREWIQGSDGISMHRMAHAEFFCVLWQNCPGCWTCSGNLHW